MKKNVGWTDQLIRIVAGVILLALIFFLSPASPWNYILVIASLVLLITGALGRCLFYKIFGLSTDGRRRAGEVQ